MAPQIVRRSVWSRRSTRSRVYLRQPVSHVIIHQVYTEKNCNNEYHSSLYMAVLQHIQMVKYGRPHIGYNFGIGEDGTIYEGCGFDTVGHHCNGYNKKSLGIVFFVHKSDVIPPESAFLSLWELLEHAVEEGHLAQDYVMHGHRQLRPNRSRRRRQCPSGGLITELQTWSHWSQPLDPTDESPDSPPLTLDTILGRPVCLHCYRGRFYTPPSIDPNAIPCAHWAANHPR